MKGTKLRKLPVCIPSPTKKDAKKTRNREYNGVIVVTQCIPAFENDKHLFSDLRVVVFNFFNFFFPQLEQAIVDIKMWEILKEAVASELPCVD